MPFEIQPIEWLEKKEALLDKPHRHPHFEIIWITKGQGFYYIDLEKYTIADNTIYCVPPGRMHLFNASGVTIGYVLSFTPEFVNLSTENPDRTFYKGVLAGFSQAGMIKMIDKTIEPEINNIVNFMVREFGNYFLLRSEILSGLLKIFLVYLERLQGTVCRRFVSSKSVDLFNKFYARLEKDFLKNRVVADYASKLAISPNYLNEMVKQVSGFSASYHIQQRVILEAKRLATYSDASMKEIAYQLGFDDLSHFSKFFKNFSGTNFREFRKHLPG